MPAKAKRRADDGWKVPGTRMLPLAEGPPRPAAYLLRVYVLLGDRTTPPWRDVLLSADDDLNDLHSTIQAAFEFDDDHLYEFSLGRNMRDRSLTYDPQPVEAFDGPWSFGPLRQERVECTATPLKKLGLQVGRRFGYHFDFGDDWWFVVEVREILAEKPRQKLPKIVARHLSAPKQYRSLDEDEEEEWEDDE
jgi:hypothetical protein